MNFHNPNVGIRARQTEGDVSAFTDAIKAAAVIMTTRGAGEAAQKAEKMGLSPRIIEGFQKASVVGGSTGGVGITSFGPAVAGAFMSSSRNVGFADELARFSMRFSDKVGRAMIYSSFAPAPTVGEGAAKVLKQVTMATADFTPVKVASLIVLTRELIDAMGDVGLRTLGEELKKSVAAGADAAFLSALNANSTDNSIVATDWAAFLDIFEEMMRLVDLGAASKPFLIVSAEMGKGIAAAALKNGVDSVQWNGGNIAGVEMRVSESQTANRLSLIDATGLATSMGELELRSAEHASIEMVDSSSQSSVTPAQVSQVSMFQNSARCLKAERTIAVKAVRTNAYVHMTGVVIGDDGGSPA